MLVNTIYDGPKQVGDELIVPDDFAARWDVNGIAEVIGNVNIEPINNDDSEEDPKGEPADNEEVDYEKMSNKQLYGLCKQRGIEVEAKQPKEVYIAALVKEVE